MNRERLDMILALCGQKKILVVGDFVLDRQLIIDQALAETSPETGLDAHQVVEVRTSPIAAGAVMSYLRALGADALAVGMIGDDGEGFELLRGLDATGMNVDNLVIRTDRFTPASIRPMVRVRGGALRELNRLDVRNRAPLPHEAEDQIIRALRGLLPRVHGVIIVDEEPEEDFGVITERVRDELAVLAQTYSEAPFVAVSRRRIGQFANVLIQASALEAVQAVDPQAKWRGEGEPDWELDRELIEAAGERLYRKIAQPVFLTLGRHGILALHAEGPTLAPVTLPRSASDGASIGGTPIAAITCALCAGASVPEAAEIAGLASGVTMRQTGSAAPTASRKQIMEMHWEREHL